MKSFAVFFGLVLISADYDQCGSVRVPMTFPNDNSYPLEPLV